MLALPVQRDPSRDHPLLRELLLRLASGEVLADQQEALTADGDKLLNPTRAAGKNCRALCWPGTASNLFNRRPCRASASMGRGSQLKVRMRVCPKTHKDLKESFPKQSTIQQPTPQTKNLLHEVLRR